MSYPTWRKPDIVAQLQVRMPPPTGYLTRNVGYPLEKPGY